MSSYEPAVSEKPIEVGRIDDCYLVVLRSHPDFPNTLAEDVEGAWSSTNPSWPEWTVDAILEDLDPPCHTDWSDLDWNRTEKKDGLEAFVVYVRPGKESAGQ